MDFGKDYRTSLASTTAQLTTEVNLLFAELEY